MLDALHSAAEMTDLARQGQTLMDRLARIPKPVVAAINGACLGGGLEVSCLSPYKFAVMPLSLMRLSVIAYIFFYCRLPWRVAIELQPLPPRQSSACLK
jgi:hypothetical protein